MKVIHIKVNDATDIAMGKVLTIMLMEIILNVSGFGEKMVRKNILMQMATIG